MLRGAKGATIDEIVQTLDWQAHTVRGATAGALKKKLGLNVVLEKSERRSRIYRIADWTHALGSPVGLATLADRDTIES